MKFFSVGNYVINLAHIAFIKRNDAGDVTIHFAIQRSDAVNTSSSTAVPELRHYTLTFKGAEAQALLDVISTVS